MKLKETITEAVVMDSMIQIESDLIIIKEKLFERIISEGVDDPGILKCVFMAGGPGSGKGFTSMEIFGIDNRFKASFSQSGLKVVNSDNAYESLLKKNGIDPKDLAKIEKEDPELWKLIAINSSSLRNQAKSVTAKQKAFYEAGRLGMIIDGTGHKYDKISKMKRHAEELGYDTFMVFVNTSLEVAKERNLNRDRIVPDDILTQSWKNVQNNLGRFKGLFGGNFEVVDNTVYKSIDKAVLASTRRFVSKPIHNSIGNQWILTARALKNANLIK